MAGEIDVILRAILSGSGFKDAGAGLDDLHGKAGKAQKALSPITNLVGAGIKAAAATGVAAVAGFTAAIVSSTLAAADMDQKVADIAAVMGRAKEAVGPLKDLIVQLGIDPKLKVSATEAADAIEMLARNGLSMGDIMEGAARNTILLSNATGADMSDAADIATDAMMLFNIQAKDMKQAVDGITGVTVNSKFKIQDYALALGTGAKGAVAANMSFDQFNQMLTATASNFTSGMTAGTSMTAMLLGLAPRTDKAADTMRELGIITTDLNAASEYLTQVLGQKVEPTFESVRKGAEAYVIQTGRAKEGSDDLIKKVTGLLKHSSFDDFRSTKAESR